MYFQFINSVNFKILSVHDQQLEEPGLLVELGTDKVQELHLLHLL